MTSQAAKGYLAQVRRALPWGVSRTRRMDRATRLVESYLAENPDTTEGALEDSFGPPDAFAAAIAGEEGVERGRGQRKRLYISIAAGALAVGLLVAAVFFCRWRGLHVLVEGGDYDVIQPAEILSPEEFEKQVEETIKKESD